MCKRLYNRSIAQPAKAVNLEKCFTSKAPVLYHIPMLFAPYSPHVHHCKHKNHKFSTESLHKFYIVNKRCRIDLEDVSNFLSFH